MYSCSVSQFLDGSSNLKAGCKKDAVHDAFDAIYMSCIHNRSSDFLCNFFVITGKCRKSSCKIE